MISIKTVTDERYHENEMSETDKSELGYYIDGPTPKTDAARFVGPLAETLGINGKAITREDAAYIMHGFSPKIKLPDGNIPNKIPKFVARLRNNADEQGLKMALARLRIESLEKKAENKSITSNEKKEVKQLNIQLKQWDEKTKKTRETEKLLDAYKDAEVKGYLHLPGTKSVKYTDEHKKAYEQLAQDYAKMDGAGRKAVDFVYSPDKPVSALYALATDKEKATIRECLKASVEEVYIRRLGTDAETRRSIGKDADGNEQYELIKADAMCVCFIHDRTRANQENDIKPADMENHPISQILNYESPGLHAHVPIFNASMADDNKFRSLHTDKLERMRLETDAEISAVLIEKLNQHNFAIDTGKPRKDAIATLSVPNATNKQIESISLRSLKIEEESNKLKLEGKPVSKRILAATTRARKSDMKSEDLNKIWKDNLEESGLTREKIGLGKEGEKTRTEFLAKRESNKKVSATDDISLLSAITKQKSYFTESELRIALYQDAMRTGRHKPEQIKQRLDKIITDITLTREVSDSTVKNTFKSRGSDKEVGKIFVTVEGLRQESEFDAITKRMTHATTSAGYDATEVRNSIKRTEQAKSDEIGKQFNFSDEQHSAIERTLCDKAQIAIVQALPGTGKTSALKGAVDFLKERNVQTIVLAPSHKAKKQAMTDAGVAEGHAVQGFVKSKKKLESIEKGAFVFVDEGSMVDLPDMLNLMKACEERGAKLVVFGDTNQLAAVGRGDPMKRMTELEPDTVSKLTKVMRQRNEAEKEAIWKQYRGEYAEAIEQLDALNLINVFETDDEKAKAFVNFYFTKDKNGNEIRAEDKILTAGTNRDCRIINDMIRVERIQRKEVSEDGYKIRAETAGGYANLTFAKGDRILFVEGIKEGDGDNAKTLADTSDTGTICSISKTADGKSVLMLVAIDGKGIVEIEAGHGAKLDHAYAITTHRSQGMTVELSGHYASTSMTGAESMLVGMSRHKGTFGLFATERERSILEELAARKTEKIRATELVKDQTMAMTQEQKAAEQVFFKANARLAEMGRQVELARLYGTDDKLSATLSRIEIAAEKATAAAMAVDASQKQKQQMENEHGKRNTNDFGSKIRGIDDAAKAEFGNGEIDRIKKDATRFFDTPRTGFAASNETSFFIQHRGFGLQQTSHATNREIEIGGIRFETSSERAIYSVIGNGLIGHGQKRSNSKTAKSSRSGGFPVQVLPTGGMARNITPTESGRHGAGLQREERIFQGNKEHALPLPNQQQASVIHGQPDVQRGKMHTVLDSDSNISGRRVDRVKPKRLNNTPTRAAHKGNKTSVVIKKDNFANFVRTKIVIPCCKLVGIETQEEKNAKQVAKASEKKRIAELRNKERESIVRNALAEADKQRWETVLEMIRTVDEEKRTIHINLNSILATRDNDGNTLTHIAKRQQGYKAGVETNTPEHKALNEVIDIIERVSKNSDDGFKRLTQATNNAGRTPEQEGNQGIQQQKEEREQVKQKLAAENLSRLEKQMEFDMAEIGSRSDKPMDGNSLTNKTLIGQFSKQDGKLLFQAVNAKTGKETFYDFTHDKQLVETLNRIPSDELNSTGNISISNGKMKSAELFFTSGGTTKTIILAAKNGEIVATGENGKAVDLKPPPPAPRRAARQSF